MSILSDNNIVVIIAALLVHRVFCHYEPRKPYLILSLLFGTPTFLTLMLHRAFPSLLRTVYIVFSLFFTTFIGSLVAYRLSPTHPLYKFPGPIINRISAFKMIQVSATGKRHLYIQDLHEKYGPYVRIGPNQLSMADANAIFSVFGAKGWPRGEAYHATLPDGRSDNLISELDVARHAEKRKAWVRGFTPAALKDYEEIILRRAKQLFEIFDESIRSKGIVDMEKWMGYYTFDFAGDLVYGGGFELMKDGKDSQGLRRNVIVGQSAHYTFKYIPWIANFIPWMQRQESSLVIHARKLLDVRRKDGTIVKDIIHYLTPESNTDDYATDPEHLLYETLLAFIGGSDTTSTVMTDLIYLLITHPDIYETLQKELDQVEQVECHEDVANLPYLEACIKETLRLISPVPTGVGRTPPKGGAFIGGHFVPEGTSVFFPHYVLHRDPQNFTSPDKFWPERWIIANSSSPPDNSFVHNWDAFVPFSFGPANCIGKNLAYREMRIVMAMILKRYRIRFAEGYDPERYWKEMTDAGVLEKGELPVVLEERM